MCDALTCSGANEPARNSAGAAKGSNSKIHFLHCFQTATETCWCDDRLPICRLPENFTIVDLDSDTVYLYGKNSSVILTLGKKKLTSFQTPAYLAVVLF